jgi:hypothetical protein
MLLIDGIKYQLWDPPSEDEFETVVKEHVNEIFGEQCIYLDKKQKLKSLSGIGSIPDGLAIILSAKPELHIVEYELSNHDVYGHVVSQISKFINGLLNSSTRQKIARIIYDEISEDQLLKIRVEQAIHSSEIFKFSTELLENKPILTIIIENKTEELNEALSPFSYPNIKDMKVVEFQTFIRERVGLQVHAHFFEPIYDSFVNVSLATSVSKPEITSQSEPKMRVTIKDLIDSGILRAGQKIFRTYKEQKYEAKTLSDGSIELSSDGIIYPSLNSATKSIVGGAWDAWYFWSTEGKDGSVCQLFELRKELLAKNII